MKSDPFHVSSCPPPPPIISSQLFVIVQVPLFMSNNIHPSIHPWAIIVSQQRQDKRSLINGTRTSSGERGNRKDPKEQQRKQSLAPHRKQLTLLTTVAATITALAITRGHMWDSLVLLSSCSLSSVEYATAKINPSPRDSVARPFNRVLVCCS